MLMIRAGVGVEHPRREDLHVAGEHDEVDRRALEQLRARAASCSALFSGVIGKTW